MICYMPNFEKRGGLVVVVVQDAATKAILMVAYTDEAGFLETLLTGEAVFYSTSRKERWKKGETSGDVQIVQDVLIDCDGDAVIYLVDQTGRGACHTGARSCFYRRCVGCQYVMPAPKLEVLPAREVEVCERLLKASLARAETVLQGNRPAEDEPLRFVLPTGSLAPRTRALLQQVGYALAEPDAWGYCGTSNGVEFYQRDRRMVPRQVSGSFDAGLTGKDLVLASGMRGMRMITELCFSRRSNSPTRWVLASRDGVLPPDGSMTVGCEYPALVQELLGTMSLPCTFTAVPIEGTEEQAIADGLCSHVLVVTETGGSLKRAGLAIVKGCENLLVSVPVLIAKPALTPRKERALRVLSVGLQAALSADERVMIKANIRKEALANVRLQASEAPTVSAPIAAGQVAIEICVPVSAIAETLFTLQEAGATAIAVQDLKGFLK